jgi:hypothetical protein
MLERKDAITNEVLEPITFVLAYPTELIDLSTERTCPNVKECKIDYVLPHKTGQVSEVFMTLGRLLTRALCSVMITEGDRFESVLCYRICVMRGFVICLSLQ